MRKVIDSHAHIGVYGEWNCGAEFLLKQMDKAGISLAVAGDLASNALGAKAALSSIGMIKPFRERFRLMLWMNPAADDLKAAEALLETDRNLFACIKVHPRTAGIPLGDERYLPCLDLCREYRLPFVSHTEQDGFADIDKLAEMAEEVPDVDFIAVHMELRSDHRRAMELIASHPNLYGDTTFVPVKDVITAVDICGTEKILYGTDAPVMGEYSYDGLTALDEALTSAYGDEAADKVLHGNCERLMLKM